MAEHKLYYGGGNCNIEGSGIRFVMIRYRGAIWIDDKTPDGFAITAQKDGIVIFPLKQGGVLNKLFEYTGEFKIISVKAVGGNGRVSTTIHRVMDYTELLAGNTETMTINTEDLKVTHTAGGKITKTKLKQPYIKNLNTSDGNRIYYFENGESYVGYYHISLEDNSVMTDGDRSDDSQLLYIKQTDGYLMSTYNPKHILPGNRIRKKQDREKRISRARNGRSNR